MPLDASRALQLAPQKLINHRSRRYSGDTICIAMEDLAVEDQAIIERMYAFLCALFKELSPPPAPEEKVGPLKEVLREFRFYQLINEIRALGSTSYLATPLERIAKTIHDLRGGALTSLIGHLDGLVDLDDETPVAPMFFPLVRDHLKIMRNSLSDLDYAKRQQDLLPRAHSIDLMVQKWHLSSYGPTEQKSEIQVDCHYPHGTISECCVESAAVDRILYNLMNNATRHAAANFIRFLILPVPDVAAAESLRFVVCNEVTQETVSSLQELAQANGDLPSLFSPGVSSTGSGLGLTIAAEFITNAYGLGHPTEAVTAGYIGARLVENEFVVWFHWPLSAWRSNPEMEVQLQKVETV